MHCPDSHDRDIAQALELAEQAVKLGPEAGYAWSVLGQAHYRHGEYEAAVDALEKSIELDFELKARSWFFLAMAHWKSGNEHEARQYYDRADQWMRQNSPPGAAFPTSQFRAEAAGVMGIETDGESTNDADVVQQTD